MTSGKWNPGTRRKPSRANLKKSIWRVVKELWIVWFMLALMLGLVIIGTRNIHRLHPLKTQPKRQLSSGPQISPSEESDND